MEEGITPNDHPPSCVFLCAQMDMSMDTHMDTSMDTHMWMSIDTHMDMSMDIHMEMPIKSKVSKLDGLYIQSEPAASLALRRRSNNPSAEGRSSKRRDCSYNHSIRGANRLAGKTHAPWSAEPPDRSRGITENPTPHLLGSAEQAGQMAGNAPRKSRLRPLEACCGTVVPDV